MFSDPKLASYSSVVNESISLSNSSWLINSSWIVNSLSIEVPSASDKSEKTELVCENAESFDLGISDFGRFNVVGDAEERGDGWVSCCNLFFQSLICVKSFVCCDWLPDSSCVTNSSISSMLAKDTKTQESSCLCGSGFSSMLLATVKEKDK